MHHSEKVEINKVIPSLRGLAKHFTYVTEIKPKAIVAFILKRIAREKDIECIDVHEKSLRIARKYSGCDYAVARVFRDYNIKKGGFLQRVPVNDLYRLRPLEEIMEIPD